MLFNYTLYAFRAGAVASLYAFRAGAYPIHTAERSDSVNAHYWILPHSAKINIY